MEEIDRKEILQASLEIVRRISDKGYQKRIWIYGLGPEVSDFDEITCDFFQDVGAVVEKYKDFKITETQYMMLKKFRDQFEIFSDNHNYPEQFIETPEWAQIMNMAKEVLKAFNYKKADK